MLGVTGPVGRSGHQTLTEIVFNEGLVSVSLPGTGMEKRWMQGPSVLIFHSCDNFWLVHMVFNFFFAFLCAIFGHFCSFLHNFELFLHIFCVPVPFFKPFSISAGAVYLVITCHRRYKPRASVFTREWPRMLLLSFKFLARF